MADLVEFLWIVDGPIGPFAMVQGVSHCRSALRKRREVMKALVEKLEALKGDKEQIKSLNKRLVDIQTAMENITGARKESRDEDSETVCVIDTSGCSNCGEGKGVVATKFKKFRSCEKCQFVFYCNRACQKQHWKIHKKDCPGQQPSRKCMVIFDQEVTVALLSALGGTEACTNITFGDLMERNQTMAAMVLARSLSM